MSDVADFNDHLYRIQSASAVFQKGIYHVFSLKTIEPADHFERIIRMYQCLFQICLTQLLLDENYTIDSIPSRLKKLCHGPKPSRKEIDVAALVTHTVFEDPNAKNAWNGFDESHPLYECSESSLRALRRTVDARHNLIYRPFMLDNLFWQDCELIKRLEEAPHIEEIEQIYIKFSKDVLKQYDIEQDEKERRFPLPIPSDVNDVAPLPLLWADLFLQYVFWVFEDQSYGRATDTILSAYARVLHFDDEIFIQNLLKYRNTLLEVEHIAPKLNHPLEWRIGEV